jgi:general secretion pathway protein E
MLAQQEWPDLQHPGRILDLDTLTQWLAEMAGLPYLRIDPLKIDVTAATAVTSHAYASRYKILPVAVETNKVVIATAEPHLRDWEAELAHVPVYKLNGSLPTQ